MNMGEATGDKSVIDKESVVKLLQNNVSDIHVNVSQEYIIITEDKTRIILIQHLNRLEKKHAWHTPVGIFIPIVATFITATFKDFIFSAAT